MACFWAYSSVHDNEYALYYLQSRYYDPALGRFINADNYPSTGQGLLGNNSFAYCKNNPVINLDASGTAVDAIFDVISLATSIAEVALNPGDPWAWAGLVGDVVDVAIPFVGGIGEAVDAMKLVKGAVKNSNNVVDAAKTVKKMVSNATGSYEIAFKSGKTYVGKGGFGRAIQSAVERASKNNDIVTSITWKKAANRVDAFIDEYVSMVKHGGALSQGNLKTYNEIVSPGRTYHFEKFGYYLD